MKKRLFVLLFSILFVLSACSSTPKSGTPIKDFNYTDQDRKPFGLKDLKGKVWVSDFVFTNCTTVCPPMTSNMSQLQQEVKDAGLEDVHFVSFSVDPEKDTPEALKKYGEAFGADFSTWHFLTGYSQEEIEDYGPKNFKTIIKKPKNDDQVIHGVRFYLFNKNGEIIADYPGNEDVPFNQIIKDIKAANKQ
ncbi:SCO family protein [Lederbergia citri]|uniref:SCO family protein n=1 Tax=Lederbergia citri TaxID=2833580 RepID=A0A942YGJ6_9BACI|nr:SCO family protein [Lederbergia citri]MBS4193566.1 SCO family protein [Lederbergia citri]